LLSARGWCREELLALSADGLREQRHPYCTIARLAFADLAGLEGSPHLSDQALRSVMSSLRAALLAEPTPRSAPCRSGWVSPEIGVALVMTRAWTYQCTSS